MQEKSGLETLMELADRVALLDRRFAVIEQNTREILNRLNMSEKPSEACVVFSPPQGKAGSIQANVLSAQEKIVAKPSIMGTSAMSTASMQASPSKGEKSIKVMGKLKNLDNRVLVGVAVTITNGGGSTVKETKTNRAGEWMCFLPPGNYRANYFIEGAMDASVQFQVTPEHKLLRVAAPQ